MAATTTTFLERNRFFNGQRLFASDLQAVEDFNRQMLWLHNQSLHQPGIGSGFAITGAKGDRQVVVQPGYAIDSKGREIILPEAVTLAAPPVAGDDFGSAVFFDLTVSYPEDPLPAAETRAGVCSVPGGAIRLREDPVFCWVRLGPAPDRLPLDAELSRQVQAGLRLRLCRAQVLNCQLDRPLSIAQRRNARLTAQPYVASGQVAGAEWTAETIGVGVKLQVPVDTLDAGFRTKPCYTAHVVGDRVFSFSVGAVPVQRVLDGFITLLSPGVTGFGFSLLIPDSLFSRLPETAADPDPRKAPDFTQQLLKQVASKNWTVEWMGVEG